MDIASQRGEPRPPCKLLDGRDIFPEEGSEEDLWWLSEISRRKQAEGATADKGDEDGPPSDSEEEDQGENGEAKEKKDDDSTDIETSSSSSRERDVSKTGRLEPSPVYEGYFEKQREARCAIHALNNAFRVLYESGW